jgi:hypothetical protein
MIEGNLHDLIIARGYWLMWRRLTPCEIVGMNGGSDDAGSAQLGTAWDGYAAGSRLCPWPAEGQCMFSRDCVVGLGVVPRHCKFNDLNCQTALTAAMGAKGIFLHCKTGNRRNLGPAVCPAHPRCRDGNPSLRARITSDWPVELFPQLQVGDGDPNSGGLV